MIIITAVGKDHPGMAHALASRLAALGCNIEDTTMTRLSGEFAMILIVSLGQNASIDSVVNELAPLENSHGLFLNVRDIDDEIEAPNEDAPRYMLSVYGPERSGLVAHITGVLARHGANITDVQTRVASGGAAYIMLYEIELREKSASEHRALEDRVLDALQNDLQIAAKEIGAQVSLRAIESETL